MAAELQAAHQQARATHAALEQLQQIDAPGSPTAWVITPPALSALGAAAGAAVLLLGATLLWRRRALQGATVSLPDSPITEIPEPDRWYADSVPPPVQEGEDPDPWMPDPPAEVFDLEAATNEVARVRKTLAERRQARARQRAEDARQLQELAELAAAVPPVSPVAPAPDSELDTLAPQDGVDVECDLPDATPAPPVEVAQAPDLELLPDLVQPIVAAPISASAPLGLSAADFDSLMEQDYAVTLALAQESEAVDLWGEARELANEVLQSHNPALKSQAHALLARLDQLESEKALEQRLWGYTP